MSKKRFTVTSALLYANGPIHIGHIAGAYLPADIFVRYQKLKGHDVLFVCGSDEHGAAITLQAKKEGISPREIVDKYHYMNQKTFSEFGIDFSIYHRTSEDLHHKTASEFFLELEKKEAFIKKTSDQFYDEKHEQFLADRYVVGGCPKCDSEEAYGDQCEKCGSALSPNELINPKSSLSGETPILKQTTHWYLPMQNHEDWIKEWIEKGMLNDIYHHDPKNWKSQVISQCKSWIESGLKERAMTRDLNWGVKVPIKNSKGKVLYVWLDAPIGYISATKQWALENKKNWKNYWQSEETELIHFIGKDNIVFHCIIFPIILKLMPNYILPNNVPANEFLNLEGAKLSTSKNWAVWLHEYLKDFKNQQDALRYALCATAPENRDADFSWKDFQSRNNNELVAILGNFINRVLVLIFKYWKGSIPKKNTLDLNDEELLSTTKKISEKIGENIEQYKFREGLKKLMRLASLGNKYLAKAEPWKMKEKQESRKETVLYVSIQIVASISILSEPFMPFSAKKLRYILGISDITWEDSKKELLPAHAQIKNPELLFKKIEDSDIEKQLDKLNS